MDKRHQREADDIVRGWELMDPRDAWKHATDDEARANGDDRGVPPVDSFDAFERGDAGEADHD